MRIPTFQIHSLKKQDFAQFFAVTLIIIYLITFFLISVKNNLNNGQNPQKGENLKLIINYPHIYIMEKIDRKRSSSVRKPIIYTEQNDTHRCFRTMEDRLIQQTNYQLYRSRYFASSEQIKDLRLVEYLGKFKSNQAKEFKLNTFLHHFKTMKDCLQNMKAASSHYNTLIRDKKFSHQKIKEGDEQSFDLRIRKDIKKVEEVWTEIFYEGSLKRLNLLLNLLGFQKSKIDVNFDISGWVISVQKRFSKEFNQDKCCECLF